ncbi:tetratricopeptide repeat protein [Roseibium sp.]|uniref:tetratricopeptide repeat protein n=1 Tax=Roseibium sp. TaxID=1936156 RepID=UPI003B511ECB
MTSTPRFKQAVANFVTIFGLIFLVGCSSSEERAENHYKRGLELVEEGELTKAGLEFRNALKLNSEHSDALFAFGEVQEQQGEIQAAFRIYNSVSEQAENHVPVRLKLVYMLLAANQTEQARKFLDEALAISPDEPEVVVAKATYELKSGNPEEAERLAKQAVEAKADLEDAYIVLASARMVLNDPAGALEYIDKAPESSLDNLGMQILKISVLDALGDDAKMEAQFAEMVERFPDSNRFGIAWAQWHLGQDRKEDAERVLRQIANDRPDDDNAQMLYVSFLISEDDQTAARDVVEKLVELRKSSGGDPFPFQSVLTQMLFEQDQQKGIDFLKSVLAEATETEQQSQARLLLAKMLFETGEIDLAETYTSEILDADSKNIEALGLRASIKISKNDNAGAADDILLALNEAPNDARLRTMLASAHERNGASVLAEEEYAKAFALDNQSAETGLPLVRFLLSHGRSAQAERVLETIRTTDPDNREVLRLMAQQKIAKQDFVGAQEIADSLRNTEDLNSSGLADRLTAAILNAQGKHEENLDFLKQSTSSTNNENAPLLSDLIRAYVQSGQQDLAIDRLNSALEEDPNDIQSRILLGSVHLSNGDPAKAEQAYKVAAANENYVSGDASLAQFYIATQQMDKAEEAMRAGLVKDENSVALQLMLTSFLQNAQRFDEAIAIFEKMFENDPGSMIVANDLASLLSERRGDAASLDRALEIAQRFRTSEVPHYLDTLGWIYYLRGEYSSALPLLRASAEGLPQLGLAQYHYGMTLAALNQKEVAIEALERALVLKTLMTQEDQETARTTIERLKKLETDMVSD